MRTFFRRALRAALPAQPPASVPRSIPCVSPARGGYHAHGPDGVCRWVYGTIEAAQARADQLFAKSSQACEEEN